MEKKKRQRRHDDDQEEDADDPEGEASDAEDQEQVQPAKRQRRGSRTVLFYVPLALRNKIFRK